MFFSSYITVAVYRWLPLEQNPHAVVHLLWNLHRYFSSPFPVFAITSLPISPKTPLTILVKKVLLVD